MPTPFREMNQSSPKTQRPLPPQGLTTGRIFYLADIGVQEESFRDPVSKKEKLSFRSKIILGIELPLHIMPKEEGKPDNRCFAIFREMSWSMSEKSKFPGFLQSIFGPRFKVITETVKGKQVRIGQLDGRELQFKDLLGVYLKVSIVHTEPNADGISYANPGSFSEFPEPQPDDPPRFQRPAPKNPDVIFDLGEYSAEAFDKLYPWHQDKVRASKEWEKMNHAPLVDHTDPEDIPF